MAKETVIKKEGISESVKDEIKAMMSVIWDKLSNDVISGFENRTILQEDLIKIVVNRMDSIEDINIGQVLKTELEKIAKEVFPAEKYSY